MKKFFAGLFVFIILVVYPATLLITIIRYQVLQPEVVKHIIRASQIGEQLPVLVADLTAPHEAEETEGLPPERMQQLVRDILPPNQVYALTDDAVDVIAEWLSTDQSIEELNLTIDLSGFKNTLQKNLGDQAEGMEMEGLPDSWTIQDFIQQSGTDAETLAQYNQVLAEARNSVERIFWFMWVGWGIIAFGVLMILLLRHKPLYVLFGWSGWTLLFMTLEAIPMTLLIWLAPRWILPLISNGTSATMIEVVNNALGAAMQVLVIPLSIVMGGTLLIGIISLVIKIVLKHHYAQPISTT